MIEITIPGWLIIGCIFLMIYTYSPSYVIWKKLNYRKYYDFDTPVNCWNIIIPLKPRRFNKKIFWLYPCYLRVRPLDFMDVMCYYTEQEFMWETLKGNVFK